MFPTVSISRLSQLHLGFLQVDNLQALHTRVLTLTRDVVDDDGDGLLNAQDIATSAQPVHSDVPQNIDKPAQRHDVRDARADRVGNGALDGRKDGAAADAHDEDAGAAARVAAEVGGAHGEDGGIHGGLEEEDGDEDGDGGSAVTGADVGVKADGEGGVDHEQEVGLEDGGQGGGDEAADGEGDEGVREEGRGLGRAEAGVLGRVVDEEGGDGHLGADVAELGDEGKDHVVLLVQGASTDAVAELVRSQVVSRRGRALENLLADLGQLGDQEQHADGGAGAGDGEIYELHVGEIVGILAREEEVGGDQGPDEGGDAVPALAELQAGRGGGRVADDDGVAVGGGLERG